MKKIVPFVLVALVVGCGKLTKKAHQDATEPATTQPAVKQTVEAVKKADPPAEKKPLGPLHAHQVYTDYLDDPKEAKQKSSLARGSGPNSRTP